MFETIEAGREVGRPVVGMKLERERHGQLQWGLQTAETGPGRDLAARRVENQLRHSIPPSCHIAVQYVQKRRDLRRHYHILSWLACLSLGAS